MKPNMKLNEGLSRGDLVDLVLARMSIDEFESKIDDDAIVVGFFVQDQDPADDLNRFIQKSPAKMIDTDVSPAPNEDGYFLVFVEFERNKNFFKELSTILKEMETLVNISVDEWSFTCYGHNGEFPLTEKRVHVLIRSEDIDVLKKKAAISAAFENSHVDSLETSDGEFKLTKGPNTVGGYLDFAGPVEEIEHEIVLMPVDVSADARREERVWEVVLGEGWSATKMGNRMLVVKNDSNFVCLVS